VRLLIVEDEIRLASALQRGLVSEGFTVEVALNGPDGLHLARENIYDAIVCDIMLPGLSGYRIIEALRAEQNWVPVLVLSAKDGEYDEADALDLGADRGTARNDLDIHRRFSHGRAAGIATGERAVRQRTPSLAACNPARYACGDAHRNDRSFST